MKNENIYTVAVLAGAYRGKSASLKATLSHVTIDGGATTLCKKVKGDSLADCMAMDQEEIASCEVCAKRDPRARG